MLLLDGDGLRTESIGMVDVEIGIGVPAIDLAAPVDVMIGKRHMQIEILRLLAPVQHDAHAVQIGHHWADRIAHILARTFHHEIGIALFLDDQQGGGIIGKGGSQGGHALIVGRAGHRLLPVLLQDDGRARNFLILHHGAEDLNLRIGEGGRCSREQKGNAKTRTQKPLIHLKIP